jgi:hypothetical protein
MSTEVCDNKYWIYLHKTRRFSFISVSLQPKSGLHRLTVQSVDHTQLHMTSRTPLNEWSARRKERYLQNAQQTQETKIHALGGTSNTRPQNSRCFISKP